MADARPELGDRGHYEQLVIDALADHDAGLTINEISGRCGGSVSATSMALASLEADGSGQFDGGRWSLRTWPSPSSWWLQEVKRRTVGEAPAVKTP
jgi:hypothetical protein